MRILLSASVLLLLGVLSGCGADEASVEDLQTGTPTAFALESVRGERDGARTTARVVFRGGGEELRLTLVLGYDPQPELVEGRWQRGDETGTVHGESVRFVGGQGQGPSVGGTYVLNTASGARYRVHLPLHRVESGWSVDD